VCVFRSAAGFIRSDVICVECSFWQNNSRTLLLADPRGSTCYPDTTVSRETSSLVTIPNTSPYLLGPTCSEASVSPQRYKCGGRPRSYYRLQSSTLPAQCTDIFSFSVCNSCFRMASQFACEVPPNLGTLALAPHLTTRLGQIAENTAHTTASGTEDTHCRMF
jgi:hypothetical protein